MPYISCINIIMKNMWTRVRTPAPPLTIKLITMKKLFKGTLFYLKVVRLRKEYPNDSNFGAKVSELLTTKFK